MGFFDGSQEGWDRGFNDGENGRSKKAVRTLRDLVSHLLKAPSELDTYVDAYNKGWEAGNWKRNDV